VTKRNEKLVKLLNGVAQMNLGDVKDHSIDAFGDAYEYLMSMYASNAGKSGGEFYTPADVSELLTRLGTVGKNEINKVYDPACGSGSLLLKVETVLGKEAVRNGFYGQEINITTYNLCRINMFLHDIGFDKFNVACEDTLIAPQHWDDEPFELIVSNSPYSIKWDGDENPLIINDPRFAPAGVLAPKSKAENQKIFS
jgi:type I restriction enzyme M protein